MPPTDAAPIVVQAADYAADTGSAKALVDESSAQPQRSPRYAWSLRSSLVRSVCLLPAGVLITIILWAIWTRTAMVPYWDEWETPLLLQRASQGTLTLGDLWSVHAASHRLFLPRIVDLLLAMLTHYNRQVAMTFDLGVSLAAAWLFYRVVRQSVRSRRLARVLVVPLSLLYFSLGQYANWFEPFQISFIAVPFGLALALWSVSTDADAPSLGWRRYGLAMVGATIAMLSAFQGLIVWIAVLPSLVRFARRNRRDVRKLLIWIGVSIEAWLVYLPGLKPSTLSGAPFSMIYSYLTAYLGGPLGYPNVASAEVVGLLGVVLLPVNVVVYWALGGELRRILPWLDAALFVALCTVATMSGRLAVGSQQALASRYQIFSALWWSALVVITGLVIEQLWQRCINQRAVPGGISSWAARTRRPTQIARIGGSFTRRRPRASMRRAVQDQHAAQRVEQVERVKHAQSRSADAHWWAVLGAQVALVLVVCAALIPANIAGIRDGLLWQDVQRLNQVSVVHYQTAPTACLTIYHPWPELIRSQLAYLQQAHLAIYSLPAATRDRLLRPQAIAGITPCTKPYRRFIDDASGQPTEPIVRRVARVDAGPSGWRLR